MALAGGSIRGGTVTGGTTPDGMAVADNPVIAPDLMATVCHAAGLDARRTNDSKGGHPLDVVESGGKPVAGHF